MQFTAFLTAAGVILNRLNVSVIAFKWYEAVRYYPSWMEIWVTLAIISMELWVFRWVITRMPVYGEAHQVVEEKTARFSGPPRSCARIRMERAGC